MAQALVFLASFICLRLKKSYCDLAEEEAHGSRQRTGKSLHACLKHSSFLNVFFFALALVLFSIFAVIVAGDTNVYWAGLVIFGGLTATFIISPALMAAGFEKKIAIGLSPVPAYFLIRLERPVRWCETKFSRISGRFNKPKPLNERTLRELLKKQQELAREDMRADLRLALTGLNLNKQKSLHFMLGLNEARKVGLNEEVGPVLLSELHDTGRNIFPVEDDSEIAGTVRLDKLTELKAGGKAAKALDAQVVAVNKNEAALYIIKKFVESGSELVFIQDDAGRTIGIAYLEDVLKELV